LPFSYWALRTYGGPFTGPLPPPPKRRLPSGRSKNRPKPPRTAVSAFPVGVQAKLTRGPKRWWFW
jgi:hypothetical protein